MKGYCEESMNRLTVKLAEDNSVDDYIVEIGGSNKIIGEGMCDRFDRLDFRKVLDKYAEVLNSSPGLTNLSTVRIETGEHQSIFQQPYHPPERLLSGIKKELDILLETNIFTPSTSAWSSPMIPVKKPNGKVRMCIDFRKLNAITVKHQFY